MEHTDWPSDRIMAKSQPQLALKELHIYRLYKHTRIYT